MGEEIRPYPPAFQPSAVPRSPRKSPANTVATVVTGTLLVLGLIALVALGGLAVLGGSICGMSCDQAQILLDRIWTAIMIGGLLAVATAIPAMIWRRWSSIFLGLGVVIVAVTIAITLAIMSTPLSDVSG